MYVAAKYSFNGGGAIESEDHPLHSAYLDILAAIHYVDAPQDYRTARTKAGHYYFSPTEINHQFREYFLGARQVVKQSPLPWAKLGIRADYSTRYYQERYLEKLEEQGEEPGVISSFRALDFRCGGLGLEVQFGKYSFMVYDILSKMVIMRKPGNPVVPRREGVNAEPLTHGIAMMPVKAMKDGMASGIGYFEQCVWDLEHRGEFETDMPVLLLGIDSTRNYVRYRRITEQDPEAETEE